MPATATDPQEAAAALGGGRLALGALVGVASFAIGGYIVGSRSPGRTILEPGISAAVAVAVGLLLGGAFTLGNLLVLPTAASPIPMAIPGQSRGTRTGHSRRRAA